MRGCLLWCSLRLQANADNIEGRDCSMLAGSWKKLWRTPCWAQLAVTVQFMQQTPNNYLPRRDVRILPDTAESILCESDTSSAPWMTSTSSARWVAVAMSTAWCSSGLCYLESKRGVQ